MPKHEKHQFCLFKQTELHILPQDGSKMKKIIGPLDGKSEVPKASM